MNLWKKTEIGDKIIVDPFEGPPREGNTTDYHKDSNREVFIFSDRALIRYNTKEYSLMLDSEEATLIKSGNAGHISEVKNTTKNIVWKN